MSEQIRMNGGAISQDLLEDLLIGNPIHDPLSMVGEIVETIRGQPMKLIRYDDYHEMYEFVWV